MDGRLERFRELLRQKAVKVGLLTLGELEETAKSAVRFHLGKPKRPRKSVVPRELKAMAKSLGSSGNRVGVFGNFRALGACM